MTPRSQRKKRKSQEQRVNVSDLIESLNTDKSALRQHHAVMTCSKCHAILGDTTSIKAVYQLTGIGGHIALGSVTNCIVKVEDFEMTEYARVLGKDNGSALVCCSSDSCGQCIGIILAGVENELLQTSFSLGLNNVDRYYLGSADMTLGEEEVVEEAGNTRIADVEGEIETLRNHIETIQRVLESHDQELVIQNKRLREHSDLLKHLL